MACQTQGIQQLLAAEKKAAEKVAEARKRKARRIKQARDEAQAEIEKYRLERDKQFKEFEAVYMGSRDNVAAQIDRNTDKFIQKLEDDVKKHKDKLIDELIHLCCDITPVVQPNYFVVKNCKGV